MPLPIEDIVAIQQLAARYNHAVDAGDGPAFAATFVEDGQLVGTPTVTGRPALDAFAAQVPAMIPKPRHVATNLLVDGDGDYATLKAYLHVVASPEGASPTIVVSGTYSDALRRENGEWLFVRREFIAD
jgi:uncharacterized protein (TIGR02246 family)